jgi:hypothetical protein
MNGAVDQHPDHGERIRRYMASWQYNLVQYEHKLSRGTFVVFEVVATAIGSSAVERFYVLLFDNKNWRQKGCHLPIDWEQNVCSAERALCRLVAGWHLNSVDDELTFGE